MNRLHKQDTNFPAKNRARQEIQRYIQHYFHLLFNDYRPSVWQRLTLKGTVILAFCGSYLSVNTDIDIPIVQPNGNN